MAITKSGGTISNNHHQAGTGTFVRKSPDDLGIRDMRTRVDTTSTAMTQSSATPIRSSHPMPDPGFRKIGRQQR